MTTRAELDTSLSQLFRVYNLARRSRRFDPARLNKALGIIQRRSTVRLDAAGKLRVYNSKGGWWYVAQVNGGCTCEDFRRHMPRSGTTANRWYCKHRIAAWLEYVMERHTEPIAYHTTDRRVRWFRGLCEASIGVYAAGGLVASNA